MSGEDKPMLHEALTGRILEACFEVSNELGAGFLESVYEKALGIALEQKGMRCKSQVSLDVQFRGDTVGAFVADLIVEDVVLVELKAVPRFGGEHDHAVVEDVAATLGRVA